MMDMFLNYFLLNVPEGILITLLMFNGRSFLENKKDYITGILTSAFIVYIIPELFPVIGLAQLYILFAFVILFKIGYDIRIVDVIAQTLVYFFIIFTVEFFAMNITMKHIALQEYFNLDLFYRLLILLPVRIFEFALAFAILKYNSLELIIMRKGTFFGKTSKRKRGV